VVVIADQVSLLDRAKDEAPGQLQAEEDYPDFNPFAEE
jgi:hypothetical protein